MAKISALVFLLLLILASAPSAVAQNSDKQLSIQWQQYLPGISGASVIQTSDGGFLALGANISTYPMINSYGTYFETVIVKTDQSGNPIWTRTYSLGDQWVGTQLKLAIQTNDGYLLAGSLGQLACLLHVDLQGNILWQKIYDSLMSIYAIIPTNDDAYAMVGLLPYVPPSPSEFQFLKVDQTGNIMLHEGYNGGVLFSSDGVPSSLFQTNDNGYVIISTVSSHGPSPHPCRIQKLDSEGKLQWQKTYGGEGDYSNDYYSMGAASGLLLEDGYLIAGNTGGFTVGFVLRTDLQGNFLWRQTYNYSDYTSTITSISRADNGFMFVGTTVPNPQGPESYTWVGKISDSGKVLNQLTIPMGKHRSYPYSIIQSTDGGHVFVGVWNESNPDVQNQKFWIVKISDNQATTPSTNYFESTTIIIAIIVAIAIGFAIAIVGLLLLKKRP